MTLVFLALGAVGFLLLIVSLVTGHEHDLGAGIHAKALGIDLSGLLGKLRVKEEPEGGRVDKR